MGRRKIADDATPESPDPRPAMNRAWELVAQMTPGAALDAVWSVPSIEYVEIAKLVPGRSGGVKVGELRPGDPNGEDLEQYVMTNWGAGVYNLSPMYKGLRIRTRSFPFGGEAAFKNAITGEATSGDMLADVDKQLSDSVRRESAMQTLERMKRLDKGEDEMTPEQLERILEKVVNARPAAPANDPMVALLEKQMSFLERQLERETARADRLAQERTTTSSAPDPNTLIGLAAGFMPLVGKLPAKSLGLILNGIGRFLRPQQEPPAETGWTPDAIMALLQTAGPMVQQIVIPVVEQIRQALVPGGGAPAAPSPAPGPVAIAAPPITHAPAAPAAPNPQGGGIVPIDLNAEEKMSMDLFFQFLSQEDYESCWSTLGTTEKTMFLNMAVMELKDQQKPESLLPLFLRFDTRVSGLIGDVSKYLAWAKNKKKPEIEAEEAEDEAAEREEREREQGGGRA